MSDEATDQATRDECYQQLADDATENRLWMELAIKWMRTRYGVAASGESSYPVMTTYDMSDRVRFALDMATIAAADRVARIMTRDLPRTDHV